MTSTGLRIMPRLRNLENKLPYGLTTVLSSAFLLTSVPPYPILYTQALPLAFCCGSLPMVTEPMSHVHLFPALTEPSMLVKGQQW